MDGETDTSRWLVSCLCIASHGKTTFTCSFRPITFTVKKSRTASSHFQRLFTRVLQHQSPFPGLSRRGNFKLFFNLRTFQGIVVSIGPDHCSWNVDTSRLTELLKQSRHGGDAGTATCYFRMSDLSRSVATG